VPATSTETKKNLGFRNLTFLIFSQKGNLTIKHRNCSSAGYVKMGDNVSIHWQHDEKPLDLEVTYFQTNPHLEWNDYQQGRSIGVQFQF
jgi:hypothetical protein